MGEKSFLSNNLLSTLNFRNIFTLAQAMRHLNNQISSSSWLSRSELGFTCDITTEWDQIEDDLMWIGGDNSRYPTVKKFYWAIMSTKNLRNLVVGGSLSGNGTFN